MRSILIIISLAFASPTWAAAPQELEKAIQFPVEKYQLKNGLTVLLHPDSSIPEVSVQTWYRVGSKDEVPGRTGLAHFFEHMMFKGTKKFGKDTFGKFLNSKGAETNASTSEDFTDFYINLPSEHLELALQIESDRMRNLNLDPKDVTSEREVVKEERRMRYDDSVEGGVHEKMSELMFTNLPYHWLPIGSMTDLNSASQEDLKAFYKTYYSPNNAVLVIAGHFQTEDAKKLVDKYYASLPREEIHRPEIKPEAPQSKERRAVIDREAQAPSVAIGYRTPDVNSEDNYALDLLAIVLGQGHSSRLYKQLVYKKEMALSTYADSWNEILSGRFMVGASLKPKADPEKALALIEEQVRTLRDKVVPQKELEKARNLFLKDYVEGLKRVSGRAHTLASYEILFNDHTRIFSDLKKYQGITPEDLRRVAKAYLQPSQRNIIVVHPLRGGGAI
jgi:zinc protease